MLKVSRGTMSRPTHHPHYYYYYYYYYYYFIKLAFSPPSHLPCFFTNPHPPSPEPCFHKSYLQSKTFLNLRAVPSSAVFCSSAVLIATASFMHFFSFFDVLPSAATTTGMTLMILMFRILLVSLLLLLLLLV